MRHLKISIPIILVISFSFLLTEFAQTRSGGQKVPDFVTSTLDGKNFALMDWLKEPDNKVLILTFFATWCELCDQDLLFLQRLQDQYADQGLRVFAVFTGRLAQIRTAKTYLEELEIKLPVLVDRKRVISKRYRVAGYPCTCAIDREGLLRFRYLGYSEGVKRKFESDLQSLLRSHDEERPKAEG
jgi:thiol-disulfide isomerase/thioredoxin